MAIDLSDYIDVAERIDKFRAAYPEGCLQSEVIDSPAPGFVAVKAFAYRTPSDPRPGVGLAWEPFPGKTPYTKDSELQNAETSAWGRAIVAVLAADTKRGIASQEEVRNRSGAEESRGGGTGGGSGGAPAAGSSSDPFKDVLLNPGGWFDNRFDKKSQKAPDFKAKKGNAPWDTAGEYSGKPAAMALWLSDAPPGFHEALEAGDVTLCYPQNPPAARGKTREEAEANLAAQLGAQEEPPPEEEPPF